MNKGQLVRLLEPFDDDVLVLVDLTREFATTRPIEAVALVLRPTKHADEILLMVGQ